MGPVPANPKEDMTTWDRAVDAQYSRSRGSGPGFAGAQARQHGRQVIGTDVDVLAHPPPQHGRGDVAAATFLLRFVQHPEDHALLAREPVAHVGEKVVDQIICAMAA